VPCKLQHYPSPVIVKTIHEPCHLRHYPNEPVSSQDVYMSWDIDNQGTQTISYYFENIRSLGKDKVYSPIFHMANTSWKMYIKKHYKKNTCYLSLYLYKVENDAEHNISCKVSATLSVLSYNNNNAEEKTFSHIFGKRQNEVMEMGWDDFMSWSILLDPNKKFVCRNEGDIQVEVDMTLKKIFEHKSFCRCPACR